MVFVFKVIGKLIREKVERELRRVRRVYFISSFERIRINFEVLMIFIIGSLFLEYRYFYVKWKYGVESFFGRRFFYGKKYIKSFISFFIFRYFISIYIFGRYVEFFVLFFVFFDGSDSDGKEGFVL